MFTRISSLALVGTLAACGEPNGDVVPGKAIACALDGAAEFAQVCSVERSGAQVTVRRPDGGFRRFEIATGGNVTSLDGADPATAIGIADGLLELTIGDDRYRLNPENPTNAPKP